MRLAAPVIACLAGAVAGQALAEDRVEFDRHILPILSENCFFCHGPDAGRRQAGLRLDVQEGAYSVLEPGDSAGSELLRRVGSDDVHEVMPPPASNRRLSPQQIDLVRRWIDQGAAWGEHWAFTRLERPPVPNVSPRAPGVVHNAIDAFVQARLARENLRPSPEAPRETLIRRVTLDLTGLPPTPDEVDAFLHDTDANAYEKVVDRLLRSPEFGERMAWDWLDAARYADSNGYQGDRERTMWPWRDWVVRAFNENLPYDEFTVWQLAGDLLPDATFEQRLATGFNRNHMINGEGGRIAEENRIEYVMDMTETMGTVWLGLTLNCCRCHDHKYDPLTRRDYYQLFAFFNQTPVTGAGGDPQTAPVLAAPTPEQQKQLADVQERLAALDAQLKERAAELAAAQGDWEAQTLAASGPAERWQVLVPDTVRAEHQELAVLDDRSILAGGPNPANDAYTVTAAASLDRITGLRLEALQHESLTQGSLSRASSGNFVLTGFEVHIRRPGDAEPQAAKIASAEATFEQGPHTAVSAFDGNSQTGWAVYEGRVVDRAHQAVFRFAEPMAAGAESTLTITLRHDSVHANHNLGRFRLSVTAEDEPRLDNADAELRTALRTPAADRTRQQAELVVQAHRRSDEVHSRLLAQREQTQKQLSGIRNAVAKVMVMQDMPNPRATHMLKVGLYNNLDDEVAADVPERFGPLSSDAPRNRLGLAQWIVSPENPLTPRVTVNRFWQQFFGIGLVKTTEDFGVQAENPPHGELLDWLAAEFRNGGWNVKSLVRLIVTSHTYRQSSSAARKKGVRPLKDRGSDPFFAGALAEDEIRNPYSIDPDNRLLARGPRFRMPSWMLRDQALAASGLLVARHGGPSVNGYQPPGIWEEATFGLKRYTRDTGDALYRRSLYTFWRRIIAPTVFFDNASRQTCTVSVFRTNTPLHSLLTFNDVTYVEAARTLAERTLTRDVAGDAERLDFAFRRVLARRPSDEERTILLGGLDRTRDEFAADVEAASKLLAVGESERRPQLDAAEHASWTALCLAILNLDEALTKE